ncbi:MAG: RNA polymerase sigma factor [Lachnospiraceae bacterium]|nr:RNA polymerase sigma factor [Lachnospiraceae bacterium]
MTRTELEQCINEYGKDIYSFCRYLTCNVQEADDLYQDTFLKAIEKKNDMDIEKNPKSYLLSVALHTWKNKKRKYMWRKRIADIQPMGEGSEEMLAGKEPSLEEQLLNKEELYLVRQAVNRLPQRFKIPILLHYMEGLSVAWIAASLKIPQGTVKSRLYHARKILAKELEDVLDEK